MKGAVNDPDFVFHRPSRSAVMTDRTIRGFRPNEERLARMDAYRSGEWPKVRVRFKNWKLPEIEGWTALPSFTRDDIRAAEVGTYLALTLDRRKGRRFTVARYVCTTGKAGIVVAGADGEMYSRPHADVAALYRRLNRSEER